MVANRIGANGRNSALIKHRFGRTDIANVLMDECPQRPANPVAGAPGLTSFPSGE